MLLIDIDIVSLVSARKLKCPSSAWLGSGPFKLGSAQLGKFQLKLITSISTFIFNEAILRNFKGYHICQFHISSRLFFHFVHSVEFFTLKPFFFFSVATKDCKTMQRYETRCPWLYFRLTGWLNALEKRLFPPPLLLKVNKSQKTFSFLQFVHKMNCSN